MRKLLMIVAAMAMLAGYSAPASAGDGRISKGLLADMGLSGMKVMSDSDATRIRGKGFAVAFSVSTSYSSDANGYNGTTSGGVFFGHHSAHAYSTASSGNGGYLTVGSATAWGH